MDWYVPRALSSTFTKLTSLSEGIGKNELHSDNSQVVLQPHLMLGSQLHSRVPSSVQ